MDVPLTIFDLALGAGPKRRVEFDELLRNAEPALATALANFAMVASQSREAINMRPIGLIAFLESDKYANIHELSDALAETFGVDAELCKRAWLGQWCDKRTQFENRFSQEPLTYAALYLAGPGAQRYGILCVVLKSNLFPDNDTAWACLNGDSLADFVAADGAIDNDSLARNLSDRPHRQYLLAVGLCDDVLGTPSENWPRLICGDTRYFEVVFTRPLTSTDIDTVRVCRSEIAAYAQIFTRAASGQRLATDERVALSHYHLVSKMLKTRKISLEVLECMP